MVQGLFELSIGSDFNSQCSNIYLLWWTAWARV